MSIARNHSLPEAGIWQQPQKQSFWRCKMAVRLMAILMRICVTLGAYSVIAPALAEVRHFPTTAELAALLQDRVDKKQGAGIVLGVMDADGSTTVVSAGSAGPDAKPLSEKSVFQIGSITKVFTSVLLAEMVRRGKVELSDPVALQLPYHAQLRQLIALPVSGRTDITMLDLATHRSGLPHFPDNMELVIPGRAHPDYSTEQFHAYLSTQDLRRSQNAPFAYSNLGSALLAYALTQIGGKPYDAMLREYVLSPLHMNMSGVELTSDGREWMVKGHNVYGEVVPSWKLPLPIAGAGGMHANMQDMLRFLAANLGRTQLPVELAIKATHTARMGIAPGRSIGLNWFIETAGKSTVIAHGGVTSGFRSFIGFDPQRQIGVVVLSNSDHSADDIALHLMNPNIPLSPPKAAVRRSKVEVDASTLGNYLGEYLLPNYPHSVAITLDSGSLFARAKDIEILLLPESDTEFFSTEIDVQISFHRDQDGKASGLTLSHGGISQHGRKVRQRG